LNIISHSGAVNSEFEQLYSKGTAIYGCTKSEFTGANLRFGILQIVIIQFILPKFFGPHNEQERWWFKIKMLPKANSHSTQDALLPLNEAPGENSCYQEQAQALL
jgi:hypothetical protein